MRIRTPVELGALIRDQRIRLGLGQKSLAEKVGVSRQWILAVEKGKARAEIGLILRTLTILGIRLTADTESYGGAKVHPGSTVDIDTIVAAARRKGRK